MNTTNGKIVNCKNCSKNIYRNKSQLSFSKIFFCSRECHNKSLKGQDTWNKGLKGVQNSTRKGKTYEEFYGIEKGKQLREKNNIWKNKTEEDKKKISTKISDTLKEKYTGGILVSPFKNPEIQKKAIENNRKKQKTIETREKKSNSRKGFLFSEKTKKTMSVSRINYCSKNPKTKEEIRKSLSRRPMSSLEIKFNSIIQKQNLPYTFVGNGKFFIERKNPDFINTNGEKIAIEVFYKKYKCIVNDKKNNKFFKEYDYSKLEHWKQDRQELFSKYGWKIIYFDETQVNEDMILKTLKEGC